MQSKETDAICKRFLYEEWAKRQPKKSCFIDETRTSPEVDIAKVVSEFIKEEAERDYRLKHSSLGRH